MYVSFWNFFETTYGTSNNSFFKTTKWILKFFGAKKKVESLLVLFLLFPVHFCLVESNENVQSSKMLCFSLAQIPKMEANVIVDPR